MDMECSDNNSSSKLVLALLKLVWSEIKARFGVKFFLATTVAICAFWSIAEAHLGYSPSDFFYAILNSYTASLSWLLWPIHQAITALGIEITLSNTWLHIVALGMFYVSTDALLMERTGYGKGYAIVLYGGSLILLIVAGVFIDVVLATFREGWLKELSLLWLWLGTISLLEIYDLCLTLSKRSVREEWSRVYGISSEEPLRLVIKSLSRLFQHQVLFPLVVLSVLILALYSDGSPVRGVHCRWYLSSLHDGILADLGHYLFSA